MILHHENWVLVGIYADEGISGTSIRQRKAFLEMIDDAMAGKIDLIVTKSVSRFARNTVDTLNTIVDGYEIRYQMRRTTPHQRRLALFEKNEILEAYQAGAAIEELGKL